MNTTAARDKEHRIQQRAPVSETRSTRPVSGVSHPSARRDLPNLSSVDRLRQKDVFGRRNFETRSQTVSMVKRTDQFHDREPQLNTDTKFQLVSGRDFTSHFNVMLRLITAA